MTIDNNTAAEMITTAVETPFGSWWEFRDYKWGAKPNGGKGKLILNDTGINHPDGIHYAEVEVRELDGDTGEVVGKWVKVTPSRMIKGIEAWCEQQDKTHNEIISDHDAIDADGALQLLVIGEVKYG